MRKRRKPLIKLNPEKIVFYLILFIVVMGYYFFSYEKDVSLDFSSDELAVCFMDANQADSTILILPEGKSVLIDAGNKGEEDKIISFAEKLGIEKFDIAVCTHPHSDHIGGMARILKEVGTEKLYMSDSYSDSYIFEELLDTIESEQINTEIVSDSCVIEDDRCTIRVISPKQKDYEELNLYSIVLKVEYGNTSFLLMGDAEKENETDMIKEYGNYLKSDVLKVGHHGSNSSSSKEFLNMVKPSLAVISVGKDNSYSHPSPRVLERLDKIGAEIKRTDVDGTIIVLSDGEKIYYK